MSFRSALLAASALLASVNSHMIMDNPVPYSADKIDNGPISAAQFPCKSNLGFSVTKMNSMAVGETQTLKFKGSAVHGGGSCQLAVTTDTEPTANSKFKVIKSIEGGCPGLNGGPSEFQFQIPDSVPNGKATFAWTWFARQSGAPEMYMNCAPIEVTGGASDTSKFDALPDMLVANIASTTCKSPENENLKFPNPGTVLQSVATSFKTSPPTGECGATGNTPSPGESSAAPIPSGAPSSAAPVPSVAPSSAGNPGVPTSNAGGVFAPSASSAAPALPTSTLTTLMTVTAAPSAPQPTVPAGTAPIGTGSPVQPTGAPGTGTGTCTEDGAVVCNGPTQFGLCNHGQVTWQQVAAGTTCQNGVISKRGYNGRIARPRAVRA